jgi:uncharacterized membrane protein YfcA
MTLALVALASLLAAGLTFFTGFGLGTILLPVLAIFLPVELAVAATAVVHLANNLYKLALVGHHASRDIALRFGVPAVLAAVLGAWLLTRMADLPPLVSWSFVQRRGDVTPLRLAIAAVIIIFAVFDLVPRLRAWRVPSRWMPLGGALSGFFGGLSGHQGALRAAFLTKAGLSRDAIIATGVVVACAIDLTRLGVYAGLLHRSFNDPATDWSRLGPLLATAILAAFLGSTLGSRLLRHVTLDALRLVIGIALILLALALASGLV